MNQQLLIGVVIGLIVGAAAGYYFGYDIGWEAALEVAQKETSEAGTAAEAVGSVETNPFENVRLNPFE